ncbi:AT DNA binding protein, putative [Talaromyces stipitatus ATCC 10500]|uniref:AT DNA binding protein, putative n=1 Tax=Talaromyces stipitatus (strain ATCC 10500 / CBS 375.48 / QM 6759 / NRRL 1006) TaxID=441959 RepID=B8M6K2_TALSN|nr:AT DNA binding protein, putative [Talaromyces stipitatus ATCC 10500]EED19464.1 AT DNA binding protein, putative [Talaromyces stipitatus ATCC 10500]
MSSVSSSASSPDVLGPEGDALYLISSPVPEFHGRQSWVPPYTMHTPRRQERAPPRTSKQQSSKTMRFNDIILPTSPMRQRSLSPTKMQSEGNLSPWRIRVTVEAEQEDDENTRDGPRKRLKPSTITTKVPLKDEISNPPSAKKRRGRPRKSNVREKSLSPVKGSPGRTPKPQPPDSISRPRGRPRKSLQTETVVQSIEPVGSPARNNMMSSTLDGVVDRESPTPFMTADMGSPSVASSEPDPFLDMAGSGAFEEQPPGLNAHRFSPPGSTEMPNKSAKSVRVSEIATPLASVSPVGRLRGLTPENTLYAGHTPRRLRRNYPTPTSSSLLDGNGDKSTTVQSNGTQTITDPTDVHHEYDTIMESEDFSMVSLDTLPSAKQAGLSSILSSSKGDHESFSQKQNAVITERTTRRTTKSPAISNYVPASSTTPYHKSPELQNGFESVDDQIGSVDAVVMNAPVSEHSIRPAAEKARKRFLSLARLVRLGLSLHKTLSYRQDLDTENSDEEEEEIVSASERLKHIFGDLDMESRRQLQAGLKFGELVARGKMRSRRLRRQEEKRTSEARERNHSAEQEPTESPQQPDTFSDDDDEDENLPEQPEMSRSQRLEAEWQQERELVSQQINMAGSDNVIVLDSDEDVSEQGEDVQEQAHEGEGEDENLEEGSEEIEDDEDYGDVWQEEARNHDSSSARHQTFTSSVDGKQSMTDIPRQASSPRSVTHRYAWDPAKGEIPPLGKSRPAQLREREVDLADLLKPRDTPKSRQYYANSSPHSALSQRLQSDKSSRYGGISRDVSSPIKPSSLGTQLVDDDPEDMQDDNVDDGVSDDQQAEEQEEQEEVEEEMEEEDDDDDIYIEAGREVTNEHTSFATSVTTPEQTISGPKQSWFRRITNNFTPGWWTASKEVPLDESQSPPFMTEEQTPSLKRSRASRDAEETREMEQVTSVTSTVQRRIKKHRLSSFSSPKLLATSGYFTDAHYVALKRLYWEAKRYPERFPYHPTPHRDEMLGDSLWTSDGEHGLPIAKIQFGILDRFVSELISADIRNGGRGQIGWTEDDLHKRLFSIIVGDEIRRERREQRLLQNY